MAKMAYGKALCTALLAEILLSCSASSGSVGYEGNGGIEDGDDGARRFYRRIGNTDYFVQGPWAHLDLGLSRAGADARLRQASMIPEDKLSAADIDGNHVLDLQEIMRALKAEGLMQETAPGHYEMNRDFNGQKRFSPGKDYRNAVDKRREIRYKH